MLISSFINLLNKSEDVVNPATEDTLQAVLAKLGGGSGGTPSGEIVPTDSGDHLNFTIPDTPLANTFMLFRGGLRITVTNGDFTLTGKNLVLAVALSSAAGETLICNYET